MNTLLDFDSYLFKLLNIRLTNSFFDWCMPFITNLNNWKIPILLFWVYLIIKGGKRGRIAAFLIIPVLFGCDQLASFVLKPWVHRLRPCFDFENVRLLVNCGGKFSFPSSHATNIAGFATLFTLFYPKKWFYLTSFALLIGYTRIYIGKHFPSDVLGGLILGAAISLLIYLLYNFITHFNPRFRISKKT